MAYKALSEVVRDPRTRPAERLRLALLFTLRYEHELSEGEGADTLDALKDLLLNHGNEAHEIGLLRRTRDFAGERRRTAGLFDGGVKSAAAGGGMSGLKAVGKMSKMMKEGLVGVENVYTRHTPLLLSTLEALFSRQGLPTSTHPVLSDRRDAGGGSAEAQRCHEVVVFIVGGATYAEAMLVAQWNAKHSGQAGGSAFGGSGSAIKRVVLGSNEMVNSGVFLRDLAAVR